MGGKLLEGNMKDNSLLNRHSKIYTEGRSELSDVTWWMVEDEEFDQIGVVRHTGVGISN